MIFISWAYNNDQSSGLQDDATEALQEYLTLGVYSVNYSREQNIVVLILSWEWECKAFLSNVVRNAYKTKSVKISSVNSEFSGMVGLSC